MTFIFGFFSKRVYRILEYFLCRYDPHSLDHSTPCQTELRTENRGPVPCNILSLSTCLRIRKASAELNSLNICKFFAFSNSHDKSIYPQLLFVISEWLGREDHQLKIRKQAERDSIMFITTKMQHNITRG